MSQKRILFTCPIYYIALLVTIDFRELHLVGDVDNASRVPRHDARQSDAGHADRGRWLLIIQFSTHQQCLNTPLAESNPMANPRIPTTARLRPCSFTDPAFRFSAARVWGKRSALTGQQCTVKGLHHLKGTLRDSALGTSPANLENQGVFGLPGKGGLRRAKRRTGKVSSSVAW
jgi:hypothetical protein